MPSYAMSQYLDLEEVMCKQLLSLDLRDPSVCALGRTMRPPSLLSSPASSSSPLSSEAAEVAAMTSSSQWGQPTFGHTHQLPSGWSKLGFWAERSVSMVETSSLGWADTETQRSPNTPSPVLIGATGSLPSSLLSSSSSSLSSSRYKTELCRTFAEGGTCKYGGKCQFAHGFEELRDLNRHPKYKTQPCRTFHTIGFCPYGIRCHFVHNNEDDLPSSSSSAAPSRPPLLKHSFSFAGFPSALRPTSPQACVDLTSLLSQAFPELNSVFEASQDPQPQFLPSPDSGCLLCGLSPAPSLTLQPPSPGSGVVQRSPSYTSLSDQDSSSSSSLSSGSDPGSGSEANGRRLPIFSQMSVPDEGLTS